MNEKAHTVEEYENDFAFNGNDNRGKPRLDYCRKVSEMNRDELKKEAKTKIWLSAFAANNPRSDYHWHVSAIYIACKQFGDLYSEAFNETYKEQFG